MTHIEVLAGLRMQGLELQARTQAGMPAPPAGVGRTWYRMATTTPDSTRVDIYDAIDPWGVSAQQFVQDLAQIDTPHIDLHINSPGGSVFDAIAIHAALVNHPAAVHTYVDGIAASAASFIAMAGADIGIEKPARMMIHDARGITVGSPTDHQIMTDLLGQISDTIAEIYADRAGGTVTSWRDAMRANNDTGTWYTARQAVDAGLADRVLNDTTDQQPANGDPVDQMPADTTPAAPADRRTQLIRARARVTLRG